MKRRMITAILVGAMLLSMVACGTSRDASQKETTADTTTTTETVQTETKPARVAADLPARNFEGETFTFFARIYENVWSASDLLAKETTGEMINDAVYTRTAYIEDTYNLTLDAVASEQEVIIDQLKTVVTAGDDTYCAFVSDVYDAGGCATEGMLYDLNTMEHIDFDARWWSQMTNDALRLGGKQFYATGDIFIVDNKAARVFYFNKGLAIDTGLEDPYQLVAENKWTLDTYISMNEAVANDVNGDGVMDPDTDVFGTMSQTNLGMVLYIGSGNTLSDKDEEDMPVLSCDSTMALDTLMGIAQAISGKNYIRTDDKSTMSDLYLDNMMRFMAGRTLFLPEVLVHIESMRASDIDIGILPPPKYTAEQEQYYCYADGWCVNVVSIPKTNTEPEKISFVLETMSADSLNNLTPAYYEVCLTDKYVRDQESVQMLDLIMNSVIMDNANVFSWGGLEKTVKTALYEGDNLASSIASVRKSVETAMQNTMDALLKN